MNNVKRILALTLALVLAVGMFAGCGPKITVEDSSGTPTQAPAADTTTQAPAAAAEAPAATASNPVGDAAAVEASTASADAQEAVIVLSFEPGTVLRMATGYNNKKTGLFFDPEVAGEGVTLADGKTYQAGDLKPTWVAVEEKLGMVFEDKYQGNSASKEFDYWKEQLDQVDMVSGTATKLNANGVAGNLVNIADYLDQMPNFNNYLNANPIVKLSITGDTDTGAIYFSPYFDGVNDIERMPLMRTDWVEKLLNGEGEFSAAASGKTAAPVCQPYMPTSGKVEVDVVNAAGTAVESVTKDYDKAGNIVEKMNAAGSISGVDAVNMLRTYIDEAYGGYYGTNRADLFIGQNAAWDADELVALLRCVVANPQTLNGTDSVQGLFSREDNNNQRRVDLFRFAGTLFGVRGMESRMDYLYVDDEGALRDARQEADSYQALDRMHAMAQEGLISKAYLDGSEESSATYLENDLGFMSYDYNQTQTLLNNTKLQDGEKYMAVMVPVAHWYDGSACDGVYMRFTESWRSVKTDGWGISKAGVGSDENKLNAALALIDFAFSPEGQILMSYGPESFRSSETFTFNGVEMPCISDATYAELWDKAGGNYTNYARQYLGSTLSFAKSQAFEYQCTSEVGKEGAGRISTAIGLGTIKHPELAVAANPWYTSVPATLPTTTAENDMLDSYTDLTSKFSQQKDASNIFCDIITKGYVEEGMTDAASAAEAVSGKMSGKQYLALENDAWIRAQDYFAASLG